jgi:prolyl oligopeptidase PreP (S9A serine peptidase family)
VLYVQTDLDAPRRRIIAIDLAAPAKENWKTVVPESKNVIESSGVIGGRLVVNYMVDARTQLNVFASTGRRWGRCRCPASARWRRSAAGTTRTRCSSTSRRLSSDDELPQRARDRQGRGVPGAEGRV